MLAGWLIGAWLVLVRGLRAPLPVPPELGPFALSWPSAVSAGVVVAAIGGVVRFVPGFSNLEAKSWEPGGRSR